MVAYYLSLFSIAVLKHHHPRQLGEERVDLFGLPITQFITNEGQ